MELWSVVELSAYSLLSMGVFDLTKVMVAVVVGWVSVVWIGLSTGRTSPEDEI